MLSIPITIYQGETFNPLPISFVDVNGNPINLTGYSAVMSAKVALQDTAFAFQVTSATSMIVINGAAGTITINIPPSVTAQLAPFTGVWDLFITSPMGYVTRLLGGVISIPESVTG